MYGLPGPMGPMGATGMVSKTHQSEMIYTEEKFVDLKDT